MNLTYATATYSAVNKSNDSAVPTNVIEFNFNRSSWGGICYDSTNS